MGTKTPDDAFVPKEKLRSKPSRLSAELELPKVDTESKRCRGFAIIALSSPGVHEGEKDELLTAWDGGEGVRSRPRTALGMGGITTWGISLTLAACKGGSLIDPRLSCDM